MSCVLRFSVFLLTKIVKKIVHNLCYRLTLTFMFCKGLKTLPDPRWPDPFKTWFLKIGLIARIRGKVCTLLDNVGTSFSVLDSPRNGRTGSGHEGPGILVDFNQEVSRVCLCGKVAFLNFLCDIHCGKYPFTPMCVSTVYFPEFCGKKNQTFYTGWIWTHDLCNSCSFIPGLRDCSDEAVWILCFCVFLCDILSLSNIAPSKRSPNITIPHYCPPQSWILSRPAPSHHARARVNQEYLSGFLYNSHGNSSWISRRNNSLGFRWYSGELLLWSHTGSMEVLHRTGEYVLFY